MYQYDTSPVHVYFDLNYINNDQSGTTNPSQLRFQQTRTTPYLLNPSNYFASLVRFQLDTTTLPIFIPQIKMENAFPNKTIYSFTMTYQVGQKTVSSGQSFMMYSPEDATATVASTFIQTITNTPNSGTSVIGGGGLGLGFGGGLGMTIIPQIINNNPQDMTTTYYYVYTYQYLCNLINQTLQSAFVNLKGVVSVTENSSLPTNNIPYFEWDTASSTFSLFCDQTGFNQNLPHNPIKIYCNSAMYRLINSMPFKFMGNNANGQNYLLRVFNDNNSNLSLNGSYSSLVMYQESTSISLMNPIQSIVFASTSLPLSSTLVSNSSPFGSNNTAKGDTNNVLSVITDFEVQVGAGNIYSPQINYVPSGDYRFFDITSNQPLSSIDILVFWKDRWNNLYPLLMESNGGNANLKLLFRRRDFNLK